MGSILLPKLEDVYWQLEINFLAIQNHWLSNASDIFGEKR